MKSLKSDVIKMLSMRQGSALLTVEDGPSRDHVIQTYLKHDDSFNVDYPSSCILCVASQQQVIEESMPEHAKFMFDLLMSFAEHASNSSVALPAICFAITTEVMTLFRRSVQNLAKKGVLIPDSIMRSLSQPSESLVALQQLSQDPLRSHDLVVMRHFFSNPSIVDEQGLLSFVNTHFRIKLSSEDCQSFFRDKQPFDLMKSWKDLLTAPHYILLLESIHSSIECLVFEWRSCLSVWCENPVDVKCQEKCVDLLRCISFLAQYLEPGFQGRASVGCASVISDLLLYGKYRKRASIGQCEPQTLMQKIFNIYKAADAQEMFIASLHSALQELSCVHLMPDPLVLYDDVASQLQSIFEGVASNRIQQFIEQGNDDFDDLSTGFAGLDYFISILNQNNRCGLQNLQKYMDKFGYDFLASQPSDADVQRTPWKHPAERYLLLRRMGLNRYDGCDRRVALLIGTSSCMPPVFALANAVLPQDAIDDEARAPIIDHDRGRSRESSQLTQTSAALVLKEKSSQLGVWGWFKRRTPSVNIFSIIDRCDASAMKQYLKRRTQADERLHSMSPLQYCIYLGAGGDRQEMFPLLIDRYASTYDLAFCYQNGDSHDFRKILSALLKKTHDLYQEAKDDCTQKIKRKWYKSLIEGFSEFSVVPSYKSIKQPLFTILLSHLCHALYKSDKAILRELSQVAKSNIEECPLHHEVITMLDGAEKNLSRCLLSAISAGNIEEVHKLCLEAASATYCPLDLNTLLDACSIGAKGQPDNSHFKEISDSLLFYSKIVNNVIILRDIDEGLMQIEPSKETLLFCLALCNVGLEQAWRLGSKGSDCWWSNQTEDLQWTLDAIERSMEKLSGDQLSARP